VRADSMAGWPGKGLVRTLLLLAAAVVVAGLASAFGIAHDYGYLHASILSGAPSGEYYALASRLAARAKQGRGTLTVVPTAGSAENITRLAQDGLRCAETFAIVQDGTPVPPESGIEVLGRLPDPEALLLLTRRDRSFAAFADLRGATIGIGPEQSGTAYLMRQLFADQDLHSFEVRLVNQSIEKQAELVARGELDLAAFVMREEAEFVRELIRRNNLDLVAPRELEGLIARHSWLSVGRIPAGFYDLALPTPATDHTVARVETLIVSGSCVRRAERVALLILLAAELPGFVRANPPKATGSATALPLASEARQFFARGEPELVDRYFPWLVNLLSPAYWVYLLMAVTILFNAMKALSRFRLWRIDSAREKLERQLMDFASSELRPSAVRPRADPVLAAPDRNTAERVRDELAALRARCQRQVASMVTPMGDEMFYRYQEFRIDEALQMAATLLAGGPPAPLRGA